MKKLSLFILIVFFTLAIFTGCSSSKDVAHSPAESNSEYDGAMSAKGDSSKSLSFQYPSGYQVEVGGVDTKKETIGTKKIIHTALLSLDVIDLDKAVTKLNEVIAQNDAFILSSSRNDYESFNRVKMVIKVPVSNYNTIHSYLKTIGEINTDEQTAQDVTEEYFDLGLRLKTLTAKHDKLTALMEKAKNVSEILQVENELNRVVYEIERIKGRLTFLDRNVSMGTITLTLVERNPAATVEKNYVDKIKFALKDGFGSMIVFIMNIVISIIWLLPFTPIILVVLFVLRKLWKFIKKRRELKKQKRNEIM